MKTGRKLLVAGVAFVASVGVGAHGHARQQHCMEVMSEETGVPASELSDRAVDRAECVKLEYTVGELGAVASVLAAVVIVAEDKFRSHSVERPVTAAPVEA